MSYKNSVKLLTSNFALVWKQLLYLFIYAVLFAVFAYFTGSPIIRLLSSNGVFHEIKVLIETAYSTPSELAFNISKLFSHILNVIFIENFSGIWLSFISLIILCFILPFILVQMSYYNISSILLQKLSMNMNVGYVQNGLRTWLQSLLYALCNILFNLPFLVLDILLISIYILTAKTILSSIIGLIILSLFYIILKSFKFTLFSCYTGYMVENNCSPFKALGKGIAVMWKKFWKILSTSIAVTLTIILINGFIILFTFFAGAIVTIPATFVFLAIYYMVIYFNTIGKRYYLNQNLIYNPIKYEVKQDEVTIIEIPENKNAKNNDKQTKAKAKKAKTKNN